MTQHEVFDDWHLREGLGVAVHRNCIEQYANGIRTFCFQDVSSVTIFADDYAVLDLSQQLGVWTSRPRSNDADSLSRVLAGAAIIVRNFNFSVNGPPAKSAQLNTLKLRVSIDFSLVCALALARTLGHPIDMEKFPLDAAKAALAGKDEERLSQVFHDYLVWISPSSAPSSVAQSHKPVSRGLSSKSFWNLKSLADAENWDDSVIVRLIEEHMSPSSSPHLMHYTNTVSGDEWWQLFQSLYTGS